MNGKEFGKRSSILLLSILWPLPPSPFLYKHISQEISLKLIADNFLSFGRPKSFPSSELTGLLVLLSATSLSLNRWYLVGYLYLSPLKVFLMLLTNKQLEMHGVPSRHFMANSHGAHMQQLKTDLQTIQKGTPIHDFVHAAKSLALALASASRPVDDEDLVLWT